MKPKPLGPCSKKQKKGAAGLPGAEGLQVSCSHSSTNPEVLKLSMQGRLAQTCSSKVLAEVIYRQAPEAQMQDHSYNAGLTEASKKAAEALLEEVQRAEAQARRAGLQSLPREESPLAMNLPQLLLNHLRQRYGRQAGDLSNMIFSLPIYGDKDTDHWGCPWEEMPGHPHIPVPVKDVYAAPLLVDDPHGLSVSALDGSRLENSTNDRSGGFYFRVLQLQPSQQKVLRVAPASHQCASNHIVVSVHDHHLELSRWRAKKELVLAQAGSKHIQLPAGAVQSPILLDMTKVSPSTLQHRFKIWHEADSLEYRPEALWNILSAEASQLLTSIARVANFKPNVFVEVASDSQACVGELLYHNCILVKTEEGEYSGEVLEAQDQDHGMLVYSLTAECAGSLRAYTVITPGRPFLSSLGTPGCSCRSVQGVKLSQRLLTK